MKLRKLRKLRTEMNGWPDTVKVPLTDWGYDPFTYKCWKPRLRPIASCRITTYKVRQWRKQP